MHASADGKLAELGMLIRAGANVGQFNHGGSSAAHFAIHFGHIDCLGLLLDAGADIGAKLTGRQSAWDLAKEAAANGLPDSKACIEAHREKKVLETAAAEGGSFRPARRV
jgi:ankyrin repeat protein